MAFYQSSEKCIFKVLSLPIKMHLRAALCASVGIKRVSSAELVMMLLRRADRYAGIANPVLSAGDGWGWCFTESTEGLRRGFQAGR